MDYKICFGIPSYLPDNNSVRSQREIKFNNLLKQLNELWPKIDILIIAQNWKNFQPVATDNRQIIKFFDPLGIIKARKILREEFLKLDYDYIILLDDDMLIEYTNRAVTEKFIEEINKHKNGFCFIHGQNNLYHPYIGAPLNLCAISKFIYTNEPMIELDPQKGEGFEDSVYACLLHYKWNNLEFNPPTGIKPVQHHNEKGKDLSTWANQPHPVQQMQTNTYKLQKYIAEHKDLPKNYKNLLISEPKKTDTTYLYF